MAHHKAKGYLHGWSQVEQAFQPVLHRREASATESELLVFDKDFACITLISLK